MTTQDRPTVPAPASTEEHVYEAVLAGQLSISEAALRVEAARMQAAMAPREQKAA